MGLKAYGNTDSMMSMTPATSDNSAMSDEHKAALAEGRSQGRVVRQYLEAVQANKPKRGRKRTQESIKNRLAKINEEIASVSALKQLQLVQERMDLEEELETMGEVIDLSELESEFVEVAKEYSERKNISYKAWREMGVSSATLSAAGISRGAN